MNNNTRNFNLSKAGQFHNTLTYNGKFFFSMILFVFAISILLSPDASCQVQERKDTLKFYDGQEFTIIGRFHSEKTYARFPEKYKNTLRKEVWNLGQHSAGISIRFRTNSPDIIVRWTDLTDNKMDHMAFTGIKGVDLYAYVNGGWRYVNTGRVKGKSNEFTLVKSGGNIYREYLLNLPLYDGIDSLSIGVKTDADISLPAEKYLIDKKPVVYYGTSIAQGGCASRPGMAFTNILSRELDRSFINMGFSGNGTCEISVGEAMSETDAALYVLDCNPNTKTEVVYERAVELVKFLKKRRPDVPVLLVEGFYYENGFEDPLNSVTEKKNIELQRAFKTLKESGIKQLYFKKGDGLIGYDHEGTVDGVHPNDLGMLRIAESLRPIIQRIIR
ncbi:MAG: SGNH/GDSL hydrolase family protein [Bacteroidales bacterium]|nr:SGNH/GDSL hydrolase family protein [Bacteroidales bacterium]